MPEPVRGECNALGFVGGMNSIPDSVDWVRCCLDPGHKLRGIDVHVAQGFRAGFVLVWKDEQ